MKSPSNKSGDTPSPAPAPALAGASLSKPADTVAPPTETSKPIEPANQSKPIDKAAPYGLKADGTPKKGPQGRPAGSGAPPGTRAAKRIRRNPEPPGTAGELPAKPAPDYVAIAQMCVGPTERLLVAGFGPKWAMEPHEKSMIEGATADYLKAKNMPDIPPGVMLLAVISMYALPRLNLEKLLNPPKKTNGAGTVNGEPAIVTPPAPTH